MRVFVTGATGFIGSAVVKELLAAGHNVLGLARSETAAQALTAAGAEVHRGDLEDLESIRAGAAACDGVIHTGFIHDFARFKEVCETDRHVITTLGAALVGTEKPLVITSGTGLLAQGQLATEADMPPAGGFNPRIASEAVADAVASLGVKVSIVRLPPSVHGTGDHGFVPMIINMAREKGVSAYKDNGDNVWPAVHRFDAAKLFRLALEKAAAPGTRYHGVAEEGIPFKQIAEAIGKGLDVPVVSKSGEEAAAHFTWFAHFAGLNNPSSAKHTQEVLGWKPTQVGLIEDIGSGGYF